MSDDATTVTLDEAKVLRSETDWDALEEKTDEGIREAVESDPDAYFLNEDWFEAATFVDPSAAKERILEFFRAEERGYQSRVNKVLREHVAVRQYKEQKHKADEEGENGEQTDST